MPGGLVEARDRAVDVGWLRSRARNRWLLWRDRLGRLQWFETGRVNLYVRRLANLGRAYQLICNGFSFTGLITDVKVLEQVLGSVRFKGAHYVFPLGQRLPKLTIDLFQKSNGIVILENVICQGTIDFGKCDRSCFYFWREEWLEKI